jgi:HPt (histidine-containing phosphotransfer) domain-containing protein
MRQVVVLFLFVIFSTLSLYASEAKGYKVVLASFAKFDDAKHALDVMGNKMSKEEDLLKKKYHFELVARPSGNVFILAIEPLESEQSTDIVVKHFRKFYSNAYSSGYFGPTKGSLVWKTKEVCSGKAQSVSIQKVQYKGTPPVPLVTTKEMTFSQLCARYFWEWVLAVFLVLIAIATAFFIGRRTKDAGSRRSAIKSDIVKVKAATHDTVDDLVGLSLWNYEAALKRADGDTELLDRRIQSFINDAPLALLRLKDSVLKNDFENTQLHSHLLKSASSNIVASVLRVMSKRLEFAAREKNAALVKENLFECERIMKETLVSLNQKVLSSVSVTNQPFGRDALVVSMVLEELQQNLEKSLFIDTDTLKILSEYPDERTLALMHELKKSIEKLDYDKALELIQHIGKMLK